MKHGPTRSASAAIATLMVFVVACGTSPSSSPTSSGREPRPTATASVAVRPSAVPSAIAGWQRSPDQVAFQDNGLTSVLWTGSRFLATAAMGDLALLDSDDGRAWRRQPPFATTAWTSGPTLVASGPNGAVAAGGGNGGPLAIWQSANGLVWTAAPDQDAFQIRDGAFGSVNAVIAADDGWLAVGGEKYNCVPTCLLRAVVLTSTDGIRWIRLPDQPAPRYADMTALARGPSGYVAVGTVMVDPKGGDAGLRAAAWTSPDGRDWTTISAPAIFEVPAEWAGEGPTDVVLRGIAARGDRLVILGDVRPASGSDTTYVPPLALTWWFDGAAWTPATIGPFDEVHEISIATVPHGFLAIIGSGHSCASGMWNSTDGSSWSCFDDPTFKGFAVRGVAASPGLEVLVGYSLADPIVAASWTLPLR